MPITISQRDAQFSFSSQISIEDIPELAQLGFRTIINNRPDFEGGNEQPQSLALEAVAKSYGLSYIHIPIIPNNIQPDQIKAFRDAFNQAEKPVIGFCKTGNRASTLYKLALEDNV